MVRAVKFYQMVVGLGYTRLQADLEGELVKERGDQLYILIALEGNKILK